MHSVNDHPAVTLLKVEAMQLRELARSRSAPVTWTQALEKIARSKGFRDWNTAVAAAKTAPMPLASKMPSWRLISSALPKLPMRIHHSGDRAYASIQELMRWAGQLELISRLVQEDRLDALGLIGGRVPYVFLNESTRWDDGLFRLCERSYMEFKGIVLSRENLEETGVIAWNKQCGVHPGDSFSVIHDEVRMSTDRTTPKQMARPLATIAVKADELHGGYVLNTTSASS